MSENAATVMLLGIALPSTLLLLGAVVLFLREKTGSSLVQVVGAGCRSSLPMCRKSFSCFLGCTGVSRIASVITSISGVRFWVSPCFRLDICSMR